MEISFFQIETKGNEKKSKLLWLKEKEPQMEEYLKYNGQQNKMQYETLFMKISNLNKHFSNDFVIDV